MPLKKDLGQWISHFEKSDAPQFKGKSKEERKDMALAAYREKYGSLEEAIDVNDPALAAFRAQMAARKKKAAEPKKSINPNYAAVKNADKIRALKQQRAQIMIDMEQEAEPEGGPIANRYGGMLNKIDAAIAKLSGRGEWGPETNPYMDKDEIERRAASLEEEERKLTYADFVSMVRADMNAGSASDEYVSDEQVSKEAKWKYNEYLQGASLDDLFLYEATKKEEDEFHKDLDKLVHKTFGHSSGEKKEMKEEVDQRNADTYAYQFMQYFDKMSGVVRHNFGDDTRKEFERLVKDKFSKYIVNEASKPDFLDVDKDGDKKETMKKALADKAMKKIKEVVKVKTPEEAAEVSKENPDAEVEVVSEVLTEGQHYDYEGKMAHSQLLSIVKNARDLFNMINSDTQLKSWVQSKLTKAEDYLDSVRTYLEGESLTSTAPAMFENESIKDETGVSLSIGDVVKGGDGRIYQVVYSYSEGKPMMVPFDLKRRKPLSLRDKIYFDSDSSIPKKLNKVMDYTATKGGFMK